MTSSELLLIEKLIQKSVEAEVSKIEEKYKKELNETKNNLVKLAKGIKMLSEGNVRQPSNQRTFIDDSEDYQGIKPKNKQNSSVRTMDRNMIRESLTGTPAMSTERALEVSTNGALPEFDAPIYIDQNSSMMKDLMDKLD